MSQLPKAEASIPVEGKSAQLSPDEQVAADIGAALLSAGMVDASKSTDLVRKISLGSMKNSDRKSLFETTKSKGGK